MTIKGVKKILSSTNSLDLDDSQNKSINMDKNLVLKKKVNRISKLVKELKGLK